MFGLISARQCKPSERTAVSHDGETCVVPGDKKKFLFESRLPVEAGRIKTYIPAEESRPVDRRATSLEDARSPNVGWPGQSKILFNMK